MSKRLFVRRLLVVTLLTAPGWCCCVIPIPRRGDDLLPAPAPDDPQLEISYCELP